MLCFLLTIPRVILENINLLYANYVNAGTIYHKLMGLPEKFIEAEVTDEELFGGRYSPNCFVSNETDKKLGCSNEAPKGTGMYQYTKNSILYFLAKYFQLSDKRLVVIREFAVIMITYATYSFIALTNLAYSLFAEIFFRPYSYFPLMLTLVRLDERNGKYKIIFDRDPMAKFSKLIASLQELKCDGSDLNEKNQGNKPRNFREKYDEENKRNAKGDSKTKLSSTKEHNRNTHTNEDLIFHESFITEKVLEKKQAIRAKGYEKTIALYFKKLEVDNGLNDEVEKEEVLEFHEQVIKKLEYLNDVVDDLRTPNKKNPLYSMVSNVERNVINLLEITSSLKRELEAMKEQNNWSDSATVV